MEDTNLNFLDNMIPWFKTLPENAKRKPNRQENALSSTLRAFFVVITTDELPPPHILLNSLFPTIRKPELAAAHVFDSIADNIVVEAGAFAVTAVGDGTVFSNAKVACRFDGVDVCPQEEEFPAVAGLFFFDHLLHAVGGVALAGVFLPVGDDYKNGMFGNVFLAGIFVDVGNVVDCPADGV